jgi:hypothetical protein
MATKYNFSYDTTSDWQNLNSDFLATTITFPFFLRTAKSLYISPVFSIAPVLPASNRVFGDGAFDSLGFLGL